ncbi:MAG: sugar ABC transporter permease [Actinobacteria bacterium RBG_16_68_21]|nr:MAG: sugar ABC transporter permease [Actinobacteria bacterium RBG_16_68_21]
MQETTKKGRSRWPLGSLPSPRSLLRTAEIDTRMLGMLGALALIWISFHFWSGGTFLTPRNLWNLSVQTSAVAIMATGMVLIIVSRNIDLSVGAVLAAVGMGMAVLQAEILPRWLGYDHWATWIIALAAGLLMGAAIGGLHGFLVAYVGVPSFIVTLAGLLVWRGVAWAMASGRTIAPMDSTFQLIGGGSRGNIGGFWSWIVGAVASAVIVALLVNSRRQRRKFGLRLRPLWMEISVGVIGCGVVLGAIGYLNRYMLPERVAAERGGGNIPFGLAIPVLLAIVGTLVITFVATRLRFGRYVFAIGGNPEAAELGGIKTRWTVMKTFILMGVLVAIAAAVQTARLNAAVSGLGQGAELSVIAAAVIGGTSLAGGVGTAAGAVLGALVMQSLQSGMVLVGVEAPVQDVAVGIVLVLAVALDTIFSRRSK